MITTTTNNNQDDDVEGGMSAPGSHVEEAIEEIDTPLASGDGEILSNTVPAQQTFSTEGDGNQPTTTNNNNPTIPPYHTYTHKMQFTVVLTFWIYSTYCTQRFSF
jgi:hypothetical protein